MNKSTVCMESYARLKNLKLVEEEIGIKWQTVYWHLKKAGVPVTGDKKLYGSTTDKLARKIELEFKRAVPFALDNNELKFQAKIDFTVGDYSIDVKASIISSAGIQESGKKYSSRWGYCISKQKNTADFFVLYALNKDESIKYIFLIPKEIAITCTTISIPFSMKSKWSEYEVSEKDLLDFFTLVSE